MTPTAKTPNLCNLQLHRREGRQSPLWALSNATISILPLNSEATKFIEVQFILSWTWLLMLCCRNIRQAHSCILAHQSCNLVDLINFARLRWGLRCTQCVLQSVWCHVLCTIVCLLVSAHTAFIRLSAWTAEHAHATYTSPLHNPSSTWCSCAFSF